MIPNHAHVRYAVLVEFVRAADEPGLLVKALGVALRLYAYPLRAQLPPCRLDAGGEHPRAQAESAPRGYHAAYAHGVRKLRPSGSTRR